MVYNQDATCARIDIWHQFLVSSISSSMGGRNIFLPGRLFPRKFPDFSGGVEEIANPGFRCFEPSILIGVLSRCTHWAEGWVEYENVIVFPFKSINSLWPGDTIWWHRSGSTSPQVMSCCLMAPSYYLNPCWLHINSRDPAARCWQRGSNSFHRKNDR